MTAPATLHVLFVCEGNIRRSPVAELLLAAALTPGGPMRPHSAGLHARQGDRIDPGSAAVLAGRAIDASGFRARPLSSALLHRAGAVITMTRAQRDAVLRTEPRALPRTVTLRELTRHAGTRPRGEPLDRLVRDTAAGRGGHRVGELDDDLADPVGRHAERLLAELVSEVDYLVERLRCGSPAAVPACPPAPRC